jgi:hypothetical protein
MDTPEDDPTHGRPTSSEGKRSEFSSAVAHALAADVVAAPVRAPSDGHREAEFAHGAAGSRASGLDAPRTPRIEVLRVAPSAASDSRFTSSAGEPRIAVLEGDRGDYPPDEPVSLPSQEPDTADTSVRQTGGGSFRFPAMLLAAAVLALLALAALFGVTVVQGENDDNPEGNVAGRPTPTQPPNIVRGDDERSAAGESMQEQPAAVAVSDNLSFPSEPSEMTAAETQNLVAEPAARAQEASALTTVRAFYTALGAGDGATAAQSVVPNKRRSGPLSAGELTRYYSSFRRPLRLLRATPVDADTVRVAYDYLLSDGRLCEGQAVVDVVQGSGSGLISRIRTQGPC